MEKLPQLIPVEVDPTKIQKSAKIKSHLTLLLWALSSFHSQERTLILRNNVPSEPH
jgi:hypothetical protein